MTYHEIAKHVDNCHSVHALLLDFRKAFDAVPHTLLIEKLIANDFDPYLTRWIVSFLSNRNQKVVLHGNSSNTIPVTSGIPQGTVIGPKLFLLYINDLPENLSCKVSLFADDTLLYQQVNNSDDISSFQKDIKAVGKMVRQMGDGFQCLQD